MHIAQDVLTDRNRIDPHKIDLMGRMGRAYYVRCSGPAIHTIMQEYNPVSIGYDQLPDHIKNSHVLTGNDIGKLAGQVTMPSEEEINSALHEAEVLQALKQQNPEAAIHYLAKTYLDKDEVRRGFSILLSVM